MFYGYLEREIRKQAKDNHTEKFISTWYPYNLSLVRGSEPLGKSSGMFLPRASSSRDVPYSDTLRSDGERESPRNSCWHLFKGE